MDVGIFPDNLFHSKPKICKFCNFPKEAGIAPVKVLSCNPNTIRFLRFSNVSGICAEILFAPKYRSFNRVDKLATDLGKTPPKLFKL